MNKSQEINLDALYRWREQIDKERIKIAHAFDKYLLTFATGTLYLSVLFTSSKSILVSKNLLGLGWVALIISIIFTMLSIFLSEQAFFEELKSIDKDIRDINENKVSKENSNCWNFFINILQIIGIISFVLGIILLSFVYYLNLK